MSDVERRSFTVASAWEMSYWSTNVMDWWLNWLVLDQPMTQMRYIHHCRLLVNSSWQIYDTVLTFHNKLLSQQDTQGPGPSEW